MSKHAWYLLLLPIVCWAVLLCWMTGYKNGYHAGHSDGWNLARRAVAEGGQLADVRGTSRSDTVSP